MGSGWPMGRDPHGDACTRIDLQEQRLASGRRFREPAASKVLVATDIAARGLDIDGIGYIINYEVPGSVDTCMHRVGRTGAPKLTGHAMTLVSLDEVPANARWKRRSSHGLIPITAGLEALANARAALRKRSRSRSTGPQRPPREPLSP